jgi:hypothetical protein
MTLKNLAFIVIEPTEKEFRASLAMESLLSLKGETLCPQACTFPLVHLYNLKVSTGWSIEAFSTPSCYPYEFSAA